MHLAAIDIGTNSLHMILVRVAADGAFEVIGREKDMVRLGAGGLEGRPLGEGAMTAALQTLSRFKRLADSRQVDDIVAVATSAVREAPNGGDFLAAVAGADRDPGPRHHGRRGGARSSTGPPCTASTSATGTAVVIDIGGGSTEITLGTAAGAQQAKSFRLGVIRLGERFVTERSARRAATSAAWSRHIRHELGRLRPRARPGRLHARHRHLGHRARPRGRWRCRCRATSRFTTGASAPRPSAASGGSSPR